MSRLVVLIVIGLSISGCQNKTYRNSIQRLFDNWEFKKVGSQTWYPAKIPGVVHTNLIANNLIEDPYWENNETKQQWIENEDWHYRTKFNITADQLSNQNIEIDFKGLDTYANVYLNKELIIEANNMFRSWRADVKSLLSVGQNSLEVIFKSPLKQNRNAVKNSPYQLPSGCETGDLQVGSYTRKAAYHFGWDWGPRFVTAGIWRAVQLNFWNSARITDLNCQTLSITDSLAVVIQEVSIEATELINKCVLELNDKSLTINLNEGINTIVDTLFVQQPKLWWTNGLGEAHLYDFSVNLSVRNHLIDSSKIKYGIRTIQLITEKDSIGTSFYFKLNGRPVFMKGANYIPQDLFLPTVTNERYLKLIQQVRDANMNMLRVWGGGIYENDIFYDLCDQNGILVWQDFMFAGSLYPNNEFFRQNVKSEVEENILRLRHHPCIALWCGNNEIEVAWHNWGWQKQFNYSRQDSANIWNNYKRIFHQIIPDAIGSIHPQGNYTSTSPLSNWGTTENFNHNSMHYWGVWHGKEDFDAFNHNIGRFMVEYGFQSFPSMSSLKSIANDSSLYLESEVMQNRQKSYIGNGMILQQIEKYFNSPANFIDFVKLSQKTQALAYQKAIKAHLDNRPHCMGTLFWQLNDCWPGPSWSVIEYDGTEKEVYSTVKSLFNEKNIVKEHQFFNP